MSILLTHEQVSEELQKLPNEWALVNGYQLALVVETSDFSHGVKLINMLAAIAENHSHHPAISLEYSKVEILLTSHEEGGLTEKDFKLASAISKEIE